MANRKIRGTDIQALLKKSEFWVGAVTVVVLLILVGRLHPLGRVKQYLASHKPTVQNSTQANSQEKMQVSPTGAQTMKKEPVMGEQKKLTHIKMLADTSGALQVVAQTHDNFWNISKRACGTGRYYLSIQATNGYQNRSLQPGDVIQVTCSE